MLKNIVGFRAWDKTEKYFVCIKELIFEKGVVCGIKYIDRESGLSQADIKDFILSQATGTKDINEFEIFGGDIIQIGGVENYEVIFVGGCFCYQLTEHHYQNIFEVKCEVIGNVYENPEKFRKKN